MNFYSDVRQPDGLLLVIGMSGNPLELWNGILLLSTLLLLLAYFISVSLARLLIESGVIASWQWSRSVNVRRIFIWFRSIGSGLPSKLLATMPTGWADYHKYPSWIMQYFCFSRGNGLEAAIKTSSPYQKFCFVVFGQIKRLSAVSGGDVAIKYLVERKRPPGRSSVFSFPFSPPAFSIQRKF